MWPQSLRRSSSGLSASSYDSLEEFLSEFEVVDKEDTAQSKAGAPQPGQSAASKGIPWAPRPPRPSVRLSSHPYQPVRQTKKLQHEGEPSGAISGCTTAASGLSQGYQQLALLPIPEPEHARAGPSEPAFAPNTSPALPKVDWGHLSDPTARHPPRHGRQVAVPAQPQKQAALSPSRAPLEHFAEQLQADLGSSLGRPPSPFQPTQQSTPLPYPQQRAADPPQEPAPATSPEIVRPPAPATAVPKARQPLVPYPTLTASNIGSGAHHTPEPPREAAGRPEGPSQIRQVLQQIPLWPPPPRPALAAESSSRDHGSLWPQPQLSSGSIPKSPVPSTLRMSQQVLRKKPKDFESELLDRLLNSSAPPAPPPVSGTSPSPAKPAFNAFHLPVSRALLVTVVLALMGVPLLLFMGGRLQAQHHLRSQVYVGAVSALTSSGEPLNSSSGDPLPGGYGLDNATGRTHPLPGDARHTGLSPPDDAEPVDVEEHSAKHKRSQVGLKLLSLRVTLSVREILDPQPLQK